MKRTLSLTLVAVVSFGLGLVVSGGTGFQPVALAGRDTGYKPVPPAKTRPADPGGIGLKPVVVPLPAKKPVVKTRPGEAERRRKVKPKFPYVSAKLNAPCGKTEFEWRCMAKAMRPVKAIRLCKEFDLVGFTAEPKKKGLIVTAKVTRRPRIRIKPGDKKWGRLMEIATRYAYDRARKRFADRKAFEDWRNFKLRFYVEGKLVATRDFDGVKLAK